jgi:FtsP/CotA-like multicopper oxidase with cupredoxin domain
LKTKAKILLALIVALAGLAPTGVPALADPGSPQGAPSAVAAVVSIDLCASNGTVTMPDSVVVPVWGFVQTATCGPNLVNDTNFPGPVLSVNEGDSVTINVTNALPGAHTLSLEALGLAFNPGPNAAAAGATLSRVFTASAPGTYLYESSGDAGRQAAMGLYGALIVRPATANQAYDVAASAYDVEATLVLSQIDPNFNASPDTFDMHTYLATYWLINGKAYPNTAPITAAGSQRVLLRYLNAGYDNTTMLLLGMHERVVARDGYLLNNPFDADAETIPAGATEDVIATVPTTAPPSTHGFPLYNRQLHVTNGTASSPSHTPGGMLTFITKP